MNGDDALKALLREYIRRTREAEERGDAEEAQRLRRRRDALSGLVGHRAHVAQEQQSKVWRDDERHSPRLRKGEA